MRRLVAFAGFLTLLGVTVVAAANLSVQSEDLTTFSTSVTVPTPAVAQTYYLKGASGGLPGALDPVAPTSNDSVQQKTIVLDGLGPGAQPDPAKHHAWQTDPAGADGLFISGAATLAISQNGGTNRITAGLFDCGPGGCVLLAAGTNPGNEGSGFKERVVGFGSLGPMTLPSGHRLRLEVVNSTGASAADWTIQWGFNPARPSQLVFGS